MYELQIHTTNNGIIRREAAGLAEFDAIRAEWSGYSTTRSRWERAEDGRAVIAGEGALSL